MAHYNNYSHFYYHYSFHRMVVLVTLAALSIGLILIEQQRCQGGEELWSSYSIRRNYYKEDEEQAYTTSYLPMRRADETDDHDQYRNRRPPLWELLEFKQQPKGDVQFLLDFAVIGHPKTATTYTLDWLSLHPEVRMYHHELHFLQQGLAGDFVQAMYNLPSGSNYKRGYKAPNDIANVQVLNLLSTYWPKTALVVGLRHPVLWFESFYNFRLRHDIALPPPDSPLFMGEPCRPMLTHGVCVRDSRFHHHLSLLGKTGMNTPDELELFLPHEPPKRFPNTNNNNNHDNKNRMKPMPHRIFLYEIAQLKDANKTRAAMYRKDFSNFLGLKTPLEPIKQSKSSSKNRTKFFDICDPPYKSLRKELMQNARAASLWIRNYFLESSSSTNPTTGDVVVSSPEYFRELLLAWMKDPCDERNTTSIASSHAL